jgi:hypothetical protein
VSHKKTWGDGGFWRLLEAAEAWAELRKGDLRGYPKALAEITGYTSGSVKTMMTNIRSGRIGPEAAERAKRLRGLPGRPVNRDFLASMMGKGLPSQVLRERLNAYRQSIGLEPTTDNVVRSTLSQIRHGRIRLAPSHTRSQ